eukprot:415261_1
MSDDIPTINKAEVIEKLLKLGFSNECVNEAIKSHTWIENNVNLNLQILTNVIVSKQDKVNKKRKLSQTNNDNSDAFQPPLKKTKSINYYKKYYNDMIQLLNEGVISYSNSKKQIRTILEQKYNYQRKYLKGNKDFDKAVETIVDNLSDIVQDNEQIKNISSLRDLKAELTARSGGCRQHGLGSHIYFEKLFDSLEMHCNICKHSLIHEISLPSHLKNNCDNTESNLLNDSAIAEEKSSKLKKCVNEWNCYEIMYWLNRVDNCKLNDIKYKCLKQQIKIGNIKGCELANINDTTLKLVGIKDINDRKLILKYIIDLIVNTNISLNTIDICEYVPDLYCDAISCELMEDPVSVTISGHIYERKFIEKYVEKYRMDPITKQKCELKDIVANKSLKQSIEMWISKQSADNT